MGRAKTPERIEGGIDEWLNSTAPRLQKSLIDFHCTITDAPQASCDKIVNAFKTKYTEKSLVFRGPPAKRRQQPERDPY